MIWYMIAAFLDKLVYGLVEIVFKVILYLADVEVFEKGTIIEPLRERVYMFLAIVMFFKIALSTIQYIVNPDELGNSDKGIGSILKNSAITIVLLAVVPTIFDFARKAQNDIAAYIPAIIMNDESMLNSNSLDTRVKIVRQQAKNMSGIALLSLASRKGTGKEAAMIQESTDSKGATVITINNSGNYLTYDNYNYLPLGDDSKFSKLNDKDIPADLKYDSNDQRFTDKRSIMYGCDRIHISNMLFTINLPGFSTATCVYDYKVPIPLIVGILMVVILVSMAIDVAIRTIKLMLLEIIAPIPIVSYIDKAKGGAFESWLKQCKDVYIDLFIRLAIIYFILFVITKLASARLTIFKQMGDEDIFTKGLVFIFLILGLLLFAKEAPKFICDVLGIKGTDNISGMFKRAGGLLGATFGGGKAALSNYVSQKERLKGLGKTNAQARLGALRSAAAGFSSALGRGMVMSAKGKGFNETRTGAFKDAIAARNRRNDRLDNLYSNEKGNEYGYWDYKRDVWRERLSIPTATAFVKVKYDVVDKLAQGAGGEKSFGATKMNETPNSIKVTTKAGGVDREFTIASARAYANIQVGTKATRWDGVEVTWSAADAAEAQAIKETVEKRTSYLKVAQLLAKGDPTAQMNREKTILDIETNASSIDTDTLATVYQSLRQALKDGGKSESEIDTLVGTDKDFSVPKLLGLLRKEAQDGDTADAIASRVLVADILTGVKDGFERDRTKKYAQAQRADTRAKKTQEAISNDSKSGSGGK